MRYTIIFILLCTSSLRAQCDSLRAIKDSVFAAQSKEIARLGGEINTQRAMIDGLGKVIAVQDSFAFRNERYRIFEREKDFKENRTWLAVMTGVILILTLMISIHR